MGSGKHGFVTPVIRPVNPVSGGAGGSRTPECRRFKPGPSPLGDGPAHTHSSGPTSFSGAKPGAGREFPPEKGNAVSYGLEITNGSCQRAPGQGSSG